MMMVVVHLFRIYAMRLGNGRLAGFCLYDDDLFILMRGFQLTKFDFQVLRVVL